ncbi:MAG: hypothetical protein ABJN26_00865 [Stappiaceae bacterium]
MISLITGNVRPKAGDLVLARVESIGSHKRVELTTGRRAHLFPGDEVILSFGNRYAPDQYEAYVPDGLEECHMVAAGGIAADAVSWHSKLLGPTCIKPLGLIGGAHNRPLNLADFSLGLACCVQPGQVFGVFGTSMNAGKTTTAASLVKGLRAAGYTVGAAKITGTGAGGDLWLMRDSGAHEVLDFTDIGMPTTFGFDESTIVAGAMRLLHELGSKGCNVAVLEVADGLFQEETAALAASEKLRSVLTGTLFAAGDAMGAVGGVATLERLNHNVLGLSGAFTQSPLAIREAKAALSLPIISSMELQTPQDLLPLLGLRNHVAPLAQSA